MEYEWDEEKRVSNLRRHGLDFADAERFDWLGSTILPDEVVDHEVRCREIGKLDGRTVFIVYTERLKATRIISLRVATRWERKLHDEDS